MYWPPAGNSVLLALIQPHRRITMTDHIFSDTEKPVSRLRKYPDLDESVGRVAAMTSLMTGQPCQDPIGNEFLDCALPFESMASACGQHERLAKGRKDASDPVRGFNAGVADVRFVNDLATAVQNVIRRQYRAIDSHRKILKTVSAVDFKEIEFFDIEFDVPLAPIDEAGAPLPIWLTERPAESGALREHGMILSARFSTLLDPRFMDIMARHADHFGKAVSQREALETYAVLDANPVMADGTELFHADHGNTVTGHAADASVAFWAGNSKLRNQNLINGTPANNELSIVVCRATSEGALRQMLREASMEHVSVLVAPDAWLGTSWYFLADPEVSPALALLTPDGQPPVQTRGMRSPPGERQMRLGLFSDFNITPLSHIGAVRVEA